jgi:hypothetical protein
VWAVSLKGGKRGPRILIYLVEPLATTAEYDWVDGNLRCRTTHLETKS